MFKATLAALFILVLAGCNRTPSGFEGNWVSEPTSEKNQVQKSLKIAYVEQCCTRGMDTIKELFTGEDLFYVTTYSRDPGYGAVDVKFFMRDGFLAGPENTTITRTTSGALMYAGQTYVRPSPFKYSMNIRLSSCSIEGASAESPNKEKLICKGGIWVTPLDELRQAQHQFQPGNVGTTWKADKPQEPLKCKAPEGKFRVLYEAHRGASITREATYVCANKISVFSESGMLKLQETLLKSTDSNMVLIENLLPMTN